MKKLSPVKMAKRNERIVKLYNSHKYSIRSLASKVSLSKSRVGEIIMAAR